MPLPSDLPDGFPYSRPANRRFCPPQSSMGGARCFCARFRRVAGLYLAADSRVGCIGRDRGADWLSYWIGLKLEHAAATVWPLSRHPDLIPRGEAFMKKWGAPGIFIGRFFGPLRAVVPLVAGIFEMPFWHFQIANFSSAFVWAAMLLTIGDVISRAVKWVW